MDWVSSLRWPCNDIMMATAGHFIIVLHAKHLTKLHADICTYMRQFTYLLDFFTDKSSSSAASNFDTVLSLIIHERNQPDAVIRSILSTIGNGPTVKPDSIYYGSKVGQLRQVVIRFNTSGALKLSQLILSSQLNLDALDVVAFQLEGGPLVWIQNRSQIARYLIANKGKY